MMSIKHVTAQLEEPYIVTAISEGFTYTMDYADRNPEGESLGTSPTGMLLTALSGCHAMTARSFLSGKKIPFSKLIIEINGEFTNGRKNWQLNANVTIKTDAQLDDREMETMERFVARNCTVSSVLQTGNEITAQIELIR